MPLIAWQNQYEQRREFLFLRKKPANFLRSENERSVFAWLILRDLEDLTWWVWVEEGVAKLIAARRPPPDLQAAHPTSPVRITAQTSAGVISPILVFRMAESKPPLA